MIKSYYYNTGDKWVCTVWLLSCIQIFCSVQYFSIDKNHEDFVISFFNCCLKIKAVIFLLPDISTHATEVETWRKGVLILHAIPGMLWRSLFCCISSLSKWSLSYLNEKYYLLVSFLAPFLKFFTKYCLSVDSFWPLSHCPIWTKLLMYMRLKKVTSGHRSPGHSKSGPTGTGDKLVIFGHFFALFLSPPTVFIGECWKCTEMFFGTIRRDLMRRNFEFLPSRSNIEGQRSNFEIRFWQP